MTNNRNGRYKFRFCAVFIIILIDSLFFWNTWYRFVEKNNQTGNLLGIANQGMAVGIYIILLSAFIMWTRGINIGVDRKANLLASHVMALFMSSFLECFVSIAITGQFRFFWRFVVRYLAMFGAQTVINSILVILFVNAYRRIYPPIEVLEIYGSYNNLLRAKMNSRPDKYRVVESIEYLEDKHSNIINKISDYEAVLINDLPSHTKNLILKHCFDIGKRVYFVPKISDILVKASNEIDLFDTPIMLCRNIGISKTQEFVKRVFDIVTSGIALVLLSPLMCIIAIAIKLEDGGPVFYKQLRCTKNLKEFYIIKFRSMIVDAEKDGQPHPAGENDDRITRVGKVIRAIRIDELPQLINILKGDMSIVGPRPERIEHVKKYTEEIPEFSLRAKVKGGLTGYAQVYGKYNTSALDKLRMDIIYITDYSFFKDIRIIFETVKILIQKESTQGFSKKQQEHIKD